MENKKITSHACVISVNDIPFEGLNVSLSLSAVELYRSGELTPDALKEVEEQFLDPIVVNASLHRVASKVDLRGRFSTTFSSLCDRCTIPMKTSLEGKIDIFLMAKEQFSPHDKPGGKVIHGKKSEHKESRHHSKSKAEVLLDTEGEHEDDSFGAFDGQTVDLRPIIRENLILQMPMRTICSQACRGLCLHCGGAIDRAGCTCKEGPSEVVLGDPDETALAKALRSKIISKSL